MSIIVCDLKECKYYKENYYCIKKIVTINEYGKCIDAEEMQKEKLSLIKNNDLSAFK